MNYKDINWGRRSSTSGFNAGDGVHFFALVQPGIESDDNGFTFGSGSGDGNSGGNSGDGSDGNSGSGSGSGDGDNVPILENMSNVGIPGMYIFRVDQEDVMLPTGRCNSCTSVEQILNYLKMSTYGSMVN